MDKKVASREYASLLHEHESGRIDREAFRAGIEQLRFRDSEQNWWQVTEDGTCLKWDGSAWQATGVRIDAPDEASASAAPPPPGAAPAVKAGSKAGRYLKHVLIRIPFVVLTFFTTWVIHTYLLAGPNGGFGRGSAGSWVFSYWGNFIPSTLLWGLVSGLFWMLVFTFFKLGREKFLPTLTRAPVMMIERIQQAGNPGLGAIVIGAGLALFFTPFNVVTGNIGFAAALFLAVFGLSSFGWAIARFIARVWLWVLKTFVKQHEERYKINLAAAHMVMVGLIPGFIISLVLKGALGFFSGIALIVLGIYLFFDLKAPTFSGKSGLFVFGLTALAAQAVMMTWFPEWALADNGGLSEAGGTWAQWWGSQGYTRVLIYGIPPSIASALGALFPTLSPEKLVTIPPEASGPIRSDVVSVSTGEVPETAATPGSPAAWPPVVGSEADGKVWYQPPWDEGGPSYIDKDQYNNIKQMEAGGYRWSNRDGWVTDEEFSERRAQEDRSRQADRLQSEKNAQAFSENERRIEESRKRQEQIQEDIKDTIRGEPITIKPYEPGAVDTAVKILTGVQYGIDQTIGIMSDAVPGGKVVSTYYTFGKNIAGDVSQGIADWSRGKTEDGLVGTLVKSTATGTIKGIQDYAGDKLGGALMDKAIPDPMGFKEKAVKYVSGYLTSAGIKEGESAVTGLSTSHPYEEAVTKPIEEAVFGQKLSDKPLVNMSDFIGAGIKKIGL